MMGISGGHEMIEYACDREDWGAVREGLRIVGLTLDRFKALSDSLLTYARVSKLKLEETDPDTLIQEVVNTVEVEARKRSIDFRVASQSAGFVIMDSQQMYRVLLNLVRNAMEAMEGRTGSIDIESGNENGGLVIRVKDAGHGIRPEHLEKIGQPFFTTKEDAGTGLGLAICYRIMKQHRGCIDVDSAPDKGTTFTLKFPPDGTVTQHDVML